MVLETGVVEHRGLPRGCMQGGEKEANTHEKAETARRETSQPVAKSAV